MSDTLVGSRIVLTGISRGIGFETARLLVASGAQIVGVARDPAGLARALAALGDRAEVTGVAVDLAEPTAPAAVARAVGARWSGIDVLINNAGIQRYTQDVVDEDVDVLERSLQVNVLGPHRLTKALLPLLLEGTDPRVINVSSGAGASSALQTEPDMPGYRLSKYALNGLTMLYAGALAGRVAVNSLDPGWVKTDLGGPHAPGEAIDGAERVLALLGRPASDTGAFWHGADRIPF